VKRRLKFTVTTVRRQVSVSGDDERFSPEDASEVVNRKAVQLCELLAAGKFHVVPDADESLAVCPKSMLEKE